MKQEIQALDKSLSVAEEQRRDLERQLAEARRSRQPAPEVHLLRATSLSACQLDVPVLPRIEQAS